MMENKALRRSWRVFCVWRLFMIFMRGWRIILVSL